MQRMNETSHQMLEPLRAAVMVPLEDTAAFRLFTEGIADWWPLASFSVGEERAQACFFEARVDGRIYERMADGSEVEWGRVQAWEPPRRVVYSWYPGHGPDDGQEIELSFIGEGDGTRLELIHRGWERRGERAAEVRASYEAGWPVVLGRYVERANSTG